MFVFSKEKVNIFNPLKTKTARHGFEKLVSNKKDNELWQKVAA
jgi:hypothetical protein